MSIDVALTGNGSYAGARSNIEGYTVTEESTPVQAGDTSGGTGGISFSAVDDPARFGSVLLIGTGVTLDDSERGVTTGRITALSGNNGMLSITADSRLGQMVTTKSAQSVNGTFTTAVTYYLSLAGITTDFTIDPTLAGLTVVAPGWVDQDLWTKFKELLVVTGAEVALIGSTITIRPVRTNTTRPLNVSSASWSVSNSQRARHVEVAYYNTEYKTDYLVIPEGGWTDESEIYGVDADELKVVNVPVNMWLSSVEQPTPADSVGPTHSSSSVYAITGGDGRRITAAQWTADGGYITADIAEDGTSINLTLKGASGATAEYAPYRIAMPTLSGEYAALRLRANGVYFKEERIKSATGAAPEVTQDIGATVVNQFIRTKHDALNASLGVAASWAGPSATISFSVPRFDKTPTFGNVAGSRVQWRRNIYRIRTVTINESSVDYTAEVDTTFNDFATSATGMTFNDFNSSFAGLTFDEFAMAPLPSVSAEYDRY